MSEEEYITDYPTKPIGGGNPYHCCAACGVSMPEINGRLEGHASWCSWVEEYREKATRESELHSLRQRVEELEAALKPFAEEFRRYHQNRPKEADAVRVGMIGRGPYFTLGDLRLARSVLEGEKT